MYGIKNQATVIDCNQAQISRSDEEEDERMMILTDQIPDNENFPLVYYHVVELRKKRKEEMMRIKSSFSN